ncbi:hypothetical protein [Hyphomonas sp.]|uniref:hypothetical protein n=1 Tax=Hyphomonas sp. TaxID=87 RepID=UPI00391A433D
MRSLIEQKESEARFADNLGTFWLCSIGLFAIGSVIYRGAELFVDPDLNGDGRFTISDIPTLIALSLGEPGRIVQVWFADHAVGQFLEFSSSPPSPVWSGVLSVAVYLSPFYALSCAEKDSTRAREQAQAMRRDPKLLERLQKEQEASKPSPGASKRALVAVAIGVGTVCLLALVGSLLG